MESCGAKFRISGLDRVRNVQGPAVFVGNHMSTWRPRRCRAHLPIKRSPTWSRKSSARALSGGPSCGPGTHRGSAQGSRADLEVVLRKAPNGCPGASP
jgi:hypothetical protein